MNEYLAEFLRLDGNKYMVFNTEKRSRLTRKYSWAVPNDQAIDFIVQHSPIIEMGAGNGYWASLVSKAGGKIDAFDKQPYKNDWITHATENPIKYFTVKKGSIEKLSLTRYKTWTLFLCWPPYSTSFAFDALQAYQGNLFIFIGEHEGGCTGDDDFFSELKKNWKIVKRIDIPRWWAIYDELIAWQRVPLACKS